MAHNRKLVLTWWGRGLRRFIFEILDLDPPINATSHYGAYHFRYNLALRFTVSEELKGECSSLILEFLKFFFSQHWLGTYERPSNPPRSSFYIVSEASYGRFSVPFLSRIHLD